MYRPIIDRVEISSTKSEIVVTPVWRNVQRQTPYSIALKPEDFKLAGRLKKAIEDGRVFTKVQAKVDANGKTYPSFDCAVMGRTLNADLKRLGY